MTTPGGVPNLPVGALTVDTLAEKLQDMSTTAMRGRAAERLPSTFDSSSGGNALSDLTPFGILTQIWAGFNSHVAGADPADIDGPEDLPGLLLNFIEELPVIGELVGLMEAILGTYDGDDEVLLAIQEIFLPIRLLLQLVAGQDVGFPSPEEIVAGWEHLGEAAAAAVRDLELNALHLFNQVPQDLLGAISHSAIGEAVTNFINDPFFAVAEAFDGLEDWFHDITQGLVGPGSAQTFADGTLKELLGNVIAVSVGQVMNISGWAKWTGLVGTGSPIMLGVSAYNAAGDIVSQANVALHNTNPATTDWTHLQGTWTVPAGVVSVRTRLVVSPSATAGTVWFDNLSATKTNPLFQNLIAGTNPGENLVQDVGHLFGGIITNAVEITTKTPQQNFDDLIAGISTAFIVPVEDVSATIQSAVDRINTFLHGGSPLNANNIASGNVADQFVSGIGMIHDTIVNALGNLDGGGDLVKMLETLTGQRHAITEHGGSISDALVRLGNLESKLNGGKADGGLVGVYDTDDFERVNSVDLGPKWLITPSGTSGGIWATPNGHEATFAAKGVTTKEFLCLRNNTAIPKSQTDYQRVVTTLGSKAERNYDTSPLHAWNVCGFNDIWLRVTDSTTSLANITGIRIRYGGDGGLYIHEFRNGVGSPLFQGGVDFIVPPGPGAILIGEAGVLEDGAPLHIRAKIGDSVRASGNTTLTLGSSSRRWGHGGMAEGYNLILASGQTIPGGLYYWAGADQVRAS